MMIQVAQLLHASPFVPFSVITSSGESFHVPHPDHALISPKGSFITIYNDNETAAHIAALHIVGTKTGRSSRSKSRA